MASFSEKRRPGRRIFLRVMRFVNPRAEFALRSQQPRPHARQWLRTAPRRARNSAPPRRRIRGPPLRCANARLIRRPTRRADDHVHAVTRQGRHVGLDSVRKREIDRHVDAGHRSDRGGRRATWRLGSMTPATSPPYSESELVDQPPHPTVTDQENAHLAQSLSSLHVERTASCSRIIACGASASLKTKVIFRRDAA